MAAARMPQARLPSSEHRQNTSNYHRLLVPKSRVSIGSQRIRSNRMITKPQSGKDTEGHRAQYLSYRSNLSIRPQCVPNDRVEAHVHHSVDDIETYKKLPGARLRRRQDTRQQKGAGVFGARLISVHVSQPPPPNLPAVQSSLNRASAQRPKLIIGTK